MGRSYQSLGAVGAHPKERARSISTEHDKLYRLQEYRRSYARVTLQAHRRPDWAWKLSSDDAPRATEYATLELNAMPPLISVFATERSDELREILLREFVAEINVLPPPGRLARLFAPAITTHETGNHYDATRQA
jgi:hypothetical protein